MVATAERHATNRRLLARDLAEALRTAGMDAATAIEMPDQCWSLAAAVVSAQRGRPVAYPSAATQELAIEFLAAMDRVAAKSPADPFAGLPS